jgi:hypothetical protein
VVGIVLKYVVGDTVGKLDLRQPNGAGGAFFVTLNNFHHGTIHKSQGEWKPFLHPSTELTGDDVWILIEEYIKPMMEGL